MGNRKLLFIKVDSEKARLRKKTLKNKPGESGKLKELFKEKNTSHPRAKPLIFKTISNILHFSDLHSTSTISIYQTYLIGP